MTMGSLIASFVVVLVGSRVSRRTALWAACVLCIVAVTLQIISTDLAALYIGRLLLGLSNGIFIRERPCPSLQLFTDKQFHSAYLQIYITESAPSFLIGSLVTIAVLMSNFGGLLGVLINNFTQRRLDKLSYQIPMTVLYFAPVVIGILLFFLPDTPRYYVIKGDYDKAANAMRRLRGITDEDSIREQIEQMRIVHVAEQEMKGNVHLFDIFKGTDLRRSLLIYGVTSAQVITGQGFLMQFSVYFLGEAGISQPFLWVMITYIISLTGNLVASLLLRYMYRKTILLLGLSGMAVSMFVMAISNSVQESTVAAGRVLVAMYVIHTWIGSAATTPSAACLTAELASQRLRPEMVGMAYLVLWGLAWLVSYTTPYFINPEQLNWGPNYAYIWGATCIILGVWSWVFLPETKGRSLEQIDELFRKKVPSRKFKTFMVESENIDDKYQRHGDPDTENGPQSVTYITEQMVETKTD